MESVESGRCHFWMTQNSEPYAHLVHTCRQIMMWLKFKVMFYPDPSFAIGVLCMLWGFSK